MSWQITVLVFVLFITNSLSQNDSLELPYTTDTAQAFEIPLFNSGSDEHESGREQQDVSGLLRGSKDAFTQFSSFQFGAARFRIRGLSAAHHQVLINGVDMADPESGIASWSNWGGLNDVTRFSETRVGVVASRYGSPGSGGYSSIDIRPSRFKRGGRVSYSSSSRLYRHRLMFSHNTGLQRSGWAFSLSASARTGEETGVPGIYFRGLSLFASMERKFALRHFISLSFFVAPLEQGRQSSATKEAFFLTGDNTYNSAWGHQNGKVRNAKVSTSNLPTAFLTHVYKKNNDVKITTSLSFQGGTRGFTGILTADAPNPQPDYYKYMPSYAYLNGDTALGDALALRWQTDPAVSQINWDKMIRANQGNLYTPPSQAGQVNSTETRGLYMLEKRVTAQRTGALNINYTKKTGSRYFSAGATARLYTARKYKVAEDLLGASFWLDEDLFAAQLGVDDNVRQNDIDRPNRKVREGERFGYDYSISLWKTESWFQFEYNRNRFDFFAASSVLWQNVWRTGHVANGKFPHSSKGRSQTVAMPGGSVRSGVIFRINGRNYFSSSASFALAPPVPYNVFVSPNVRNDLVEGLSQEKRSSAEISYHHNSPGLRCRLTYFITAVNNQVGVRTYWHDVYNTTVNQIIKKMNTLHQGVEASAEKQFSGRHILQAVLGWTEALYKGQPLIEAWRDNDAVNLLRDEKSYLNNYRGNSAPQLAAGGSYRYNGRRSWHFFLALNYFDFLYVDVNPYRRTAEAAGKFTFNETDQLSAVIAQERLPSWLLFNCSAGKSFRIKKTFLSLALSINNVLNDRRIITNGFEQLRFDPANPTLFANKYTYLPGRSYMFTTTLTL